jgi:tetratricopeptide (TPR) repeat protein
LFRKAIDADGSFALARARLPLALLNRLWWHHDLPDSVAETARTEAARSLELRPDLPEGHLAMGYYHYYTHRDYEPALKEFEIARQGIPAEATAASAYIFRRTGKFDEAARRLETAARLDPQSSLPLELARTLFYMRRYEEADRRLKRLLDFAPDSMIAAVLKAAVRAAWKGESEPVQHVLRKIRGKASEAALGPGLVFLLDLNPREALQVVDSLESDALLAQQGTYPKAYLRAAALDGMGETALAAREYSEALPALAAEIGKHPDSGYQHSMLARAYAGLGRKQDALREAERAVAVMPISRDSLSGSMIAAERARVETRTGEIEAALGHIRELLAIPGVLSPALLRIDPAWGPLRANPRFREMAGL